MNKNFKQITNINTLVSKINLAKGRGRLWTGEKVVVNGIEWINLNRKKERYNTEWISTSITIRLVAVRGFKKEKKEYCTDYIIRSKGRMSVGEKEQQE